MAIYRLSFRASKPGQSTQFTIETDVPEQIKKFFGNSNYKNEVNNWLANIVPLDKKKIYNEFSLITYSKK